MLGSADPEHTDSSDRSAAYKNWWRLWMQKLGNCLCWISSKLNIIYVLMIVHISLYAEWKSTEIYVLMPI